MFLLQNVWSGNHRQKQFLQTSCRLGVEPLEDRRLLAVVTVDTDQDVIDDINEITQNLKQGSFTHDCS